MVGPLVVVTIWQFVNQNTFLFYFLFWTQDKWGQTKNESEIKGEGEKFSLRAFMHLVNLLVKGVIGGIQK